MTDIFKPEQKKNMTYQAIPVQILREPRKGLFGRPPIGASSSTSSNSKILQPFALCDDAVTFSGLVSPESIGCSTIGTKLGISMVLGQILKISGIADELFAVADTLSSRNSMQIRKFFSRVVDDISEVL